MADVPFVLEVVSAEGRLFRGLVRSVRISGSEGELGILHGHAPLLTAIKPGLISYRSMEDKDEVMYVSGGLLEVQPAFNEESDDAAVSVTVLADTAVRGKEIDEAKAEEEARAAQEAFENAQNSSGGAKAGDTDYATAIVNLSRAMARLHAAQISNHHYN
ncbi:MAG: F0F1 ATP synthase subunit epsilon [Succinivibrionaceae bacterium]|jgi:F-type H+-transporting ATPase subunit epsilon|nr:F0F1 ATP synthase subunit epsilon [Succinivibrionaceae bacterium]